MAIPRRSIFRWFRRPAKLQEFEVMARPAMIEVKRKMQRQLWRHFRSSARSQPSSGSGH